MSEPLFEARRLAKSYGLQDSRVDALKGVDLTIGDGEFVAITGPSGSGKSTLLGLLGMLARPSGGELYFRNQDIGRLEQVKVAALRNAEIGFVFQSFQLLDRTSALENVELPLVYADIRPKERRARAMIALEQVGLADRIDHHAAQLSGGEQQRVAIARAIVNRPSVILADEPTGALDIATGEEILSLLNNLHQLGTSIVVITHNLPLAAGAERRLSLVDGVLQPPEQPRDRVRAGTGEP